MNRKSSKEAAVCGKIMRRTGRLALLLSLLKRRRAREGHFPPIRSVTRGLALARRRQSARALYKALLVQRQKNRVRRRARRWWVRPIFQDHEALGAWFTLIPSLRRTDTDRYYNFMRMTPESFDRILQLVTPFLTKRSWRKSVCPGERLAITLRYLASGDSMTSLSHLFRVSDQCISNIILETTTVLWHSLKPLVFESLSEELWLRVASEFEVTWHFPHCVGAIDGKLVQVQAFAHRGSKYFSYKKNHSLILMGVADAKYKFIVVDSGSCGRRGDGNVFHRSTFGRKLNNGTLHLPPSCAVEGFDKHLPFMFVGDAAFEQSMHLVTPFKGMFLPPEEAVYNFRLSTARRVVENAFGILCARFRVLRRSIIASESTVKSIILSCVALHNWHLMDEDSVPPNRRRYRPEGYADYFAADGTYVYGRWRNENPSEEKTVLQELRNHVLLSGNGNDRLLGEEVVERLIEYFVENPVPWQWRHTNLA